MSKKIEKKVLKKTVKKTKKNNKKKGEQGRPTEYKKEYDKITYRMCLLGATDKDLAGMFEVSETTINNWKLKEKSFFESIKKGKEIADSKMAESLYKRGRGYKHKAVKIFYDKEAGIVRAPYIEHYPPDTAAAFIWLKNRQPKLWKDKKEIELQNRQTEAQQKLAILTDEELQAEIDKIEKAIERIDN